MLTFQRIVIVCVLTVMVLAAAQSTSALAESKPYRIGLASTRITPEEPVRLSGYASRDKPSTGVAHDLYAKAMVIEDSTGHRGVLITTDLIGFPAAIAEPICSMIAEACDLSREQILLNSSHTHTGPSLALEPDFHNYPPEHAAATVRYTRGLQKKLVAIVSEAIEELEPGRLSRGVGVATFVMNRREFTEERGVILGVNPRGLVDRSVPLLRVDSPDGRLRAVLFGTACHNTTLGGRDYQISGDFAGYSQARVEKDLPGVQAMFMQGCGGDANPFPRGSEEISRIHGQTLGTEVLRILKTDLTPVEGPLRTLLRSVELPLQTPPSREQLDAMEKRGGGWRRYNAKTMREYLDEGKQLPQSYSTPVAVWQFGDDLTLVGLPGEVVVDYVRGIEAAIGRHRLWVSAYCNDVFGYIPSADTLENGGYETRGLYYGGIGLFAPEVEKTLVEFVGQLAREAGRTR